MSENTSQKRVLIDKANASMMAVICIVAAMVVFSLVSVRALWKQSIHKSHVIKAKKTASTTMAANDLEIGKLITSFKAFEASPESVIGTSEKNSKVVLDALPSAYDFPALASSLEKILTEGGYTIDSISGTDNELIESSGKSSSKPEAVEIPFNITVSGPYDKIKNLPVDLERSIRPVYITSLILDGSATNAKLELGAKTFYQPGKNLDVRFTEVK